MKTNRGFKRIMSGYRFRSLILSAGMVMALAACTSLNNPFWPAAEVSVVDIKGVTPTQLIGISQSLGGGAGSATGQTILYTYNEPVVSLRNPANLPSVVFNKFEVSYRLSDGTVLPSKEYPLFKSLRPPAVGGAQTVADTVVSIQFQVLSADSDLRAVVFPGNSAPRVSDGVANITLFGRDDNGHQFELEFVVPLNFNSLVFAEGQPVGEPEPSPTPETSGDLNDLVTGLNQNT